MPAVRYRNKSVELNDLSLDDLQKIYLSYHKAIATIEEQLEYPLLLAEGGKREDTSGATFALKQYKASIPLIEQAIAARRKQQRIEEHNQHNQPKTEGAKGRRQKSLAEFFVQVAWEKMNEPLFDNYMAEAKKRRKNGNG
jgi:hypothetical protein